MSEGGSRLRSFVLGGIVGGAVAVVAGRITEKRRTGSATPPGLEAFERAPCFGEGKERQSAPVSAEGAHSGRPQAGRGGSSTP